MTVAPQAFDNVMNYTISQTDEAALRYDRDGLKLCRLDPGSKAPRYPGWQHHPVSPEHWKQHPNDNLGCIHGLSGTVAVDVDHVAYTKTALAAVGLELSDLLSAGVRSTGNPDRAKVWYRWPAPPKTVKLTWPHPADPKESVMVLELRGDGGQDVLPPSKHPSGYIYTWPAGWPDAFPEPPTKLVWLWKHWPELLPVMLSACPWYLPPGERPPRRTIEREGPSVIEAFNQAHDVGAILERNGFTRKGKDRYLRPGSGTKVAGVQVYSDVDGEYAYDHPASSPLGDGHKHDAFSAYCILEHGGDQRAAARAAADPLGMSTRQSEPLRRNARDQWPEPEPLITRRETRPFPVNSLPALLADVVRELHGYVQAPVPLVVNSVLAVTSLCAQGVANVARDSTLIGPILLYLLVLGDSGERKSAVDTILTDVLKIRWERPRLKEWADTQYPVYEAAMDRWKAECEGVKAAITKAKKEGKPTAKLAEDLEQLKRNSPPRPPTPILFYEDSTPESLAFDLLRDRPSGGVFSAEAGIVFGGHSMTGDSVMRNLALLNKLWEDSEYRVSRRTKESFHLYGKRTTLCLAVQESTLREFIAKTGKLMRGTGFSARFLMTTPASTQGNRPYKNPPEWKARDRLMDVLIRLLDRPLCVDDKNRLVDMPVIRLSKAAEAVWVDYYNAVETELRPGGEMELVKDVASKSADNAARLAANFHIIEHEGVADTAISTPISDPTLRQAATIAAWYLYEGRRVVGDLGLSDGDLRLAQLDEWLIEHCRENGKGEVSTRAISQYGPYATRKKEARDATLNALANLGRVRSRKEGRQRFVEVNPALLDSGSVPSATATPATSATDNPPTREL